MSIKLLRQILFRMSKRSIQALLLNCLLLGTMYASGQKEQQIKSVKDVAIKLKIENADLVQVLQHIEYNTDYKFSYRREDIDPDFRFTGRFNKASVADILLEISRQTNLKFRQVNNNIHISQRKKVDGLDQAIEVIIQGRTITGKVISGEDQSELPGVNVVVKGTSYGTVTDIEGSYSLEVPEENSILVFSSVGFVEEEMNVANQTVINMTMKPDITALEEIVVTGYGVQKKVNLTGAVSTVDFDEEMLNRPITNASQALNGTVPGIWVSQNSGKPGSDGAQIRVRGWGTLNNANPLIIIDGIEGSFEEINPNDIENITVLKDAASAAIYGSKAANGVVLITTKMGKSGEKMKISLNSYYGMQSLGRRYDVVNNSAEHMRLSNLALANEGASPLFPDGMISDFENSTDPFRFPNTNWFDVLFDTAPVQEHNLSIQGGTEKSTTFLSVNYLNQEGMVPNTGAERYGIRANVEMDVNNWFKVSGRINYNRRTSTEAFNDAVYGSLGRVFTMLSGATPYIAPYTRNGEFGAVEAIDTDGNVLYDNRNPLIDAANGQRYDEQNFLTLNVAAEIKFTDFLKWRTTVASTGNWLMRDNFNESIVGYTDSGIPMMTKNYNREGIEISRTNRYSLANNVFSTLNFDKEIATGQEISAILGIQIEDTQIKSAYSRRSQPPKEGLTQVDAGTNGIQGEGNMVGLKILSYFGRLNYSIAGKYLLEANIRADGSSRFREGRRWGIFPGFSAGWRLGDEAFIKDLGLFSNLKLRASWGQLGNQNIAGYWPYLTVIAQNNNLSYSYNGSFAPGAAVTALIDEDITWETTTTLDFGIDIGLFEDRINIEADYFSRKTTDIIVQLPIPDIMGNLTPPYENEGEMINQGFEYNINYNHKSFDGDQLGYNIGLNMTHINNEVTKFRGGDSPDQLYLIREGYSYRTLYGYKVEGIYQSDAEAEEHMSNNGFKPMAGNLRYEDVNGDGRLGFEDRQDIGNTIPKLTFGVNAGFQFKGFDLNLLFQGASGVNAFVQNAFTTMSWENRMISTSWRDAWSPQNTDTDVPILLWNSQWDEEQSSYWVRDLSYLKLQNAQLGYSVSKDLISRIGLQRAYLYLNAQNVFVIVSDEFEGYDPEKNTFSASVNEYPVPRIVSLGVNLSF